MKSKFYGVRTTRKDGSTFLAYGTQPPCAVFRSYKEAVAYKTYLQPHVRGAKLKIVKIKVSVEECS